MKAAALLILAAALLPSLALALAVSLAIAAHGARGASWPRVACSCLAAALAAGALSLILALT